MLLITGLYNVGLYRARYKVAVEVAVPYSQSISQNKL